MRIEPNYTSIGRLFQEAFIFRVPMYQRGYAWGDSQIEDFLRDLCECYSARVDGKERHHLFGGVVSVEGNSPGASRRQCELIDGQQRLATFVMFVSYLIVKYKSLSEVSLSQAESAERKLASSRSGRLTSRYIEYEHEINRKPVNMPRFQLSTRDESYLKELMRGTAPEPSRDSHERLRNAFRTIKSKIDEIIDSQQTMTDKLDALERFEKVLDDDCTIIHIVTDSHAEAYRLFQVLNDRGVSLTEGDLLRARTLELLNEPEYAEQQKLIEIAWDAILADTPEFTKDFFMWFYASIKGKRPGKTSLFDNFIDGIFPQHSKSKITTSDARKIVSTVNQMQKEVIICRKLIEGEWPFDASSQQIKNWDKDRLRLLLKALDHTLCMPLLLSAANVLEQNKFIEIVQLIEVMAFRYKNISSQHTTSLSNIYHSHAVAIRSKNSSYKVSTFRADLRELQERKVPDSVFVPMLRKQLAYNQSGGNKTLKYFLLNAEYYMTWFEGDANGRPKCRDKSRVFDFLNTTLEHIYPLKPGASVRDSTLDPLVNSLGNLTFLGPEDNDILSNKGFDLKKPKLSISSVKMNRDIAANSEWNASKISEREDKLVSLALKVFNV